MQSFLPILVTVALVQCQDYVDLDKWFPDDSVVPNADYTIDGVRVEKLHLRMQILFLCVSS